MYPVTYQLNLFQKKAEADMHLFFQLIIRFWFIIKINLHIQSSPGFNLSEINLDTDIKIKKEKYYDTEKYHLIQKI